MKKATGTGEIIRFTGALIRFEGGFCPAYLKPIFNRGLLYASAFGSITRHTPLSDEEVDVKEGVRRDSAQR
jgi:hypothetical protein